MRVLKSKSLMNLILGVLLALPMCAVASRVIYVQANKNAYQSYSDYTETQTTNVALNTSLIEGQTYTFNFMSYESSINSVSYEVLNYQTNLRETYFPNETWKVVSFTCATSSNRTRLIITDEQNTQHNLFDETGSFYFVSNGVNTTTTQNVWYTISTLSYTTGKLDNVFEYSISKFVEENDFGQMNLVSWFSGMFLSDTVHNNLYVNFINWYLNYAMLVTLVHFMFLVLMWFINYCRRIIDRSMNYDF